MKRVLDKIRLVKSFPKEQGYKQYNAHIAAAHGLIGTDDFGMLHEPHQTIFYKGFKGKLERNGLRISFGSSSIGTYIAVESTPHKLTDDEWVEVRAYLQVVFGGAEIVANEFRLFEIEFAVDIPLSMSELVIFAPKFRKINLSNQADGQVAIGSKQGNRWIRIYDKKKQLKEKKGIAISGELTRIEFVVRRLPFTLGQCESFPSPFDDLIVLYKSQIPEIRKGNPTDFGLRHFCDKVMKGATGHIAYWDVEDAGMRKSVCKLLRPFSLGLAGEKNDWVQWSGAELSKLKSMFGPDA